MTLPLSPPPAPSRETPAQFVAFDLLARGDDDLCDRPFVERRRALEELLAGAEPPLALTPASSDPADADRVARARGRRHRRRRGEAGRPPLSPRRTRHGEGEARANGGLRGRRLPRVRRPPAPELAAARPDDDEGALHHLGVVQAFTNKRRAELLEELAPLAAPIAPVRVAEVAYDQLDSERLRHPARFRRWRPDRDPRSCTPDQLTPASADTVQVLQQPT